MRPTFLVVFLAASALAQNSAPPAFEVASVKINPQFRQEDRATWITHMDLTPGSLTIRNFNLTMLVARAYDVQQPLVSGPEGIDAQRYDIVAKPDGPVTDGQAMLMLRTLLVERFKLVVHEETRPVDVMAMLLPKGGHKMTPSKPDAVAQSREDPVRGRVIEGAPLAELAKDISRELGIPIVDMTGLKGRFDFTFNVTNYLSALRSRFTAPPYPPDAEVRVMLMQDVFAGELGLRLEPRKAPVQLIVIDRAEKSPVEN